MQIFFKSDPLILIKADKVELYFEICFIILLLFTHHQLFVYKILKWIIHTCKTHLAFMEVSKMLTLELKSFCKFTSKQVTQIWLIGFAFFVTAGASKGIFHI